MKCRPLRMRGRSADMGLKPSVVLDNDSEGMVGMVGMVGIAGAVVGTEGSPEGVVESGLIVQLQAGSHML